MTKTKSLLATLFIFVLVATTVKAQDIAFGFKGGVNFANVHATQTLDQLIPDLDNITTLSFGGVAELGLHENFALQSELLFTQKGFGIRQGVDVNLFNVPLPLGVTAETRINYIELPLLAKAKFGDKDFKGFLTAGPTIGFATSGRLVTKANVILDFNLTNTSIDLDAIDFQRFEIGGAVGGGVAMNTDFGELFVEARYNHGFTQLYDIPLVDERLRNRNISLNAGLLIPIN